MPTDDDFRGWTDGARELARHLVERGMTMHAFCEATGLDYAAVHKALSGERGRRVSLDFSLAVQRASNGAVPHELWRDETRTMEEPVATPRKTTAQPHSTSDHGGT